MKQNKCKFKALKWPESSVGPIVSSTGQVAVFLSELNGIYSVLTCGSYEMNQIVIPNGPASEGYEAQTVLCSVLQPLL